MQNNIEIPRRDGMTERVFESRISSCKIAFFRAVR